MWSAARSAKISMILCMPERVSGGDANSKVSAMDGINGRDSPFRVNIRYGECSLTLDVISDTFETELAGVPVALDVREWLSE